MSSDSPLSFFFRQWSWLIITAVIAVVFYAGQWTGSGSEKINSLEAFQQAQLAHNQIVSVQLSDIDGKLATLTQAVADLTTEVKALEGKKP